MLFLTMYNPKTQDLLILEMAYIKKIKGYFSALKS